jgi:uncharacterized membrane protein
VSKPDEFRARKQIVTVAILWALLALYAAARILQVFPGRVPMLAVVALHVLPPAIFALIHGAMFYRARGILFFVTLCLVLGNIFENLGVLIGFPYGRYHFTDLMGPKLFAVPVLLGLAYVGMAYLSWTLAHLILANGRTPLTGMRVAVLPLLAAFIMVAWDLAMDPVWGTVLHAWIWKQGGTYFGVPVSNFVGWYLTVYVIFQIFALHLRRRTIHPRQLPSGYWHLAIVFYAVSAAGNLILAIPHNAPTIVSDAAGVQWKVTQIVGVCVLVSVFVMGTFAMLAWTRLARPRAGDVNQSLNLGLAWQAKNLCNCRT